jgi:hypothetical protein
MSKLMGVMIAAGLSFAVTATFAQNPNSSNSQAAQGAAGTMSNYNSQGERQSGLEQYLAEQQQCEGMSGDAKRDCAHLAKVRYQGWAIMQCELVSGPSRQRCYQNIQANVMSNRSATAGAVRNSTGTDSSQSGQTVRPADDEDKAGRQ